MRCPLLLSVLAACGFTGPNTNGPGDGPIAGDAARDAPIVDGSIDGALGIDALVVDAPAMIDGPAPPIPCANPIRDEPFTNPSTCAPWASYFANIGVALVQGGGSLVGTVVSNAPAGGAACTQFQVFTLTTGGAIVEVPQVVGGGGTYTALQLLKNQSVGLGLIGNQFRFGDSGGGTTYKSVPYDAVAMRWWRLRLDAAGTGIAADTSPDGVTWNLFHDQPTAIEQVRINVIVGTNGGGTSGASRFTRLVVCP